MEHVYLLREREFVRIGEDIYKIGKTRQTPKKRFHGYPKNSEIILIVDVDDCTVVENRIKKVFNQRFRQRRDIGIEYYQGDRTEIIKMFRACVENNISTDISLLNITYTTCWFIYRCVKFVVVNAFRLLF